MTAAVLLLLIGAAGAALAGRRTLPNGSRHVATPGEAPTTSPSIVALTPEPTAGQHSVAPNAGSPAPACEHGTLTALPAAFPVYGPPRAQAQGSEFSAETTAPLLMRFFLSGAGQLDFVFVRPRGTTTGTAFWTQRSDPGCRGTLHVVAVGGRARYDAELSAAADAAIPLSPVPAGPVDVRAACSGRPPGTAAADFPVYSPPAPNRAGTNPYGRGDVYREQAGTDAVEHWYSAFNGRGYQFRETSVSPAQFSWKRLGDYDCRGVLVVRHDPADARFTVISVTVADAAYDLG